MNKLTIAAIAFAAFLVPAFGASAHGPGFNCAYADRAAERAVCASKRLSRLDLKLNYWYAKAKERARHFDQTRWLRNKQRSWLRARNSCGWNRYCIARKYRQRIRELRNYYTHV